MKNSIRANREGIIDKVHISEGAHVQQSQDLFTFRKDR